MQPLPDYTAESYRTSAGDTGVLFASTTAEEMARFESAANASLQPSERFLLEHIENSIDYEDIAATIMNNGYKRVALQFPDAYLCVSLTIMQLLKEAVRMRQMVPEAEKSETPSFYILGDHSMSPCCTDVIGAVHINADFIVTFGTMCFSRADPKVPVYFVQGTFPLGSIERMSELIANAAAESDANHVYLMLDAAVGRSCHQFATQLQAQCQSINASLLLHFPLFETVRLPCATGVNQSDSDDHHWMFLNRKFEVSPPSEGSLILYVAPSQGEMWEWRSLLCSTRLPVCSILLHPTPTASPIAETRRQQNQLLKQRGLCIEKVKNAQLVGIVVQPHCPPALIEQLKHLLQQAGKGCLLLSMSKLLPHKLTAFTEVECYCWCACHMSAILDRDTMSEFHVPIVTAAELALGCVFAADWYPFLSSDPTASLSNALFQAYLQSAWEEHVAAGGTHQSLVSMAGSFHSSREEETESTPSEVTDSMGTLALRDSNDSSQRALVALQDSKLGLVAAQHFQDRGWQGLEIVTHGPNQPIVASQLEEGQSGLPAQYEGEGI
jgi:diphthamide biosynthesis protein 2